MILPLLPRDRHQRAVIQHTQCQNFQEVNRSATINTQNVGQLTMLHERNSDILGHCIILVMASGFEDVGG